FIRQVSCYAFFSEMKLPESSYFCLNKLVFFVVFDKRVFRRLNFVFGSYHQFCLPKMAHFASKSLVSIKKTRRLTYLKYESRLRAFFP
ncbi:hypothetical protein K501DRAFT_202749, partial [Backusella circina FSU 941]